MLIPLGDCVPGGAPAPPGRVLGRRGGGPEAIRSNTGTGLTGRVSSPHSSLGGCFFGVEQAPDHSSELICGTVA